MAAPNGQPGAARAQANLSVAAQSGSGRRQSFCALRVQFEQTLETLKQVFRWTGELAGGEQQAGGWPADSRSLLLLVGTFRARWPARLNNHLGRVRRPPLAAAGRLAGPPTEAFSARARARASSRPNRTRSINTFNSCP